MRTPAQERENARKRRWENEHDRKRCPCGALRSPCAHRKRPDGLCRACRDEVRLVGQAMRRERIAEMHAAGSPLVTIAAFAGVTRGALGVEIAQMRRDGWDVPYRSGYGPTGRRAA